MPECNVAEDPLAKIWRPADATVFSCEWKDYNGQVDSPVGHYHVVYSYQVDGTLYTGRFVD